MKLLFTGANGFLGKNVIPILKNKGVDVKTLSRNHSDYNADLPVEIPNINEEFDVVFHAAGKAHSIPKTAQEKEEFYLVNFEGTKNLSKSLEKLPPRHFIYVSSVAVYGREEGLDITEKHPLGGITPYAKSKILAENYLQEWCSAKGVILTILRPSLIAGKNPPGNLGSMIKGIKGGYYFNIGNGEAKKSVVWAEDFAEIITLAVESNGGIFNVADDNQPTFGEIASIISKKLGRPNPKNIPYNIIKVVALVGDLLGEKSPITSLKLKKITSHLTFSNQKIKSQLKWKPTNVLQVL